MNAEWHALPDAVATMTGSAAMARDNGTLVFAAPWEGRAVALAVATIEQLDLPWDEFRNRLIQAIAETPDRPYYESWAIALERLVTEHSIAAPEEISAATPTERPPL